LRLINKIERARGGVAGVLTENRGKHEKEGDRQYRQ